MNGDDNVNPPHIHLHYSVYKTGNAPPAVNKWEEVELYVCFIEIQPYKKIRFVFDLLCTILCYYHMITTLPAPPAEPAAQSGVITCALLL